MNNACPGRDSEPGAPHCYINGECVFCLCAEPTRNCYIVRSYHPSQSRPSSIIKRGLSLEEAQSHCKDPSTKKDGVYFDGYDTDDKDPEEESRKTEKVRVAIQQFNALFESE